MIENNKKRWLNPSEFHEEFGFSKSSQAKMRMSSNASNIPFSKIGKRVMYDRQSINIWLENHQIQGAV